MGFHLLAYSESQNPGATPNPLTAAQDGWANISTNGNFYLPQALRYAGGYAQGATMVLAQVVTPSLRQIGIPYITPIVAAAAVPSNYPVMIQPDIGPWIPKSDELGVSANNGGGGAEQQTAFLWMHDGNLNIGREPIITVRSATTNTTGNLVWGESGLALDQPLPAGRYRVVGMDAVGTNLLAARLRFPQAGPMPGVLGRATTAIFPNPIFRMGRMGSFGEFDSLAPPMVQFFGSGAPTTQNVYLDLQKIG